MNAQLIFDAKATLGEGPVWDAKTQTLFWIDILEKRIYAGENVIAQLDQYIGCFSLRPNGTLLIALSDGEGRSSLVNLQPFDPAQGKADSSQQTVLAAVSESAANRFNDGKCDPAGRFLAGTMAMNESDPTGALYSFDGKQVTKLFDGVTISNGLTWSPDHKTFYYIDTPTRKVQAFDYDLTTGQIANPRIAIQVPASLGWPDGMTSDTDGNLWIALWGGAQVSKWNPQTGQLLEQIPVPALQTSSCIFGGKDMNELYITSARKGMSEENLKQYPLSGGLFKVETKVTGMPTFEFIPR
jgi:sugar lactone lactonase YvrE